VRRRSCLGRLEHRAPDAHLFQQIPTACWPAYLPRLRGRIATCCIPVLFAIARYSSRFFMSRYCTT